MNKEYVICDKADLVAVADVVREKTGGTDSITVEGLADAVRGANVNLDTEITEQENIIDLIQTALEGKAAGGSGGGITMPEMVTINYEIANTPNGYNGMNLEYWGIDENNQICNFQHTITDLTGSFTCIKDSWVEFYTNISWDSDLEIYIGNITGTAFYEPAYVGGYVGDWLIRAIRNDNITIELY